MTAMPILNPAYRRDNLAPFYVLDDIFRHEDLDRILAYCKEADTEKAVVAQSQGTPVMNKKMRRFRCGKPRWSSLWPALSSPSAPATATLPPRQR